MEYYILFVVSHRTHHIALYYYSCMYKPLCSPEHTEEKWVREGWWWDSVSTYSSTFALYSQAKKNIGKTKETKKSMIHDYCMTCVWEGMVVVVVVAVCFCRASRGLITLNDNDYDDDDGYHIPFLRICDHCYLCSSLLVRPSVPA